MLTAVIRAVEEEEVRRVRKTDQPTTEWKEEESGGLGGRESAGRGGRDAGEKKTSRPLALHTRALL